jgi:putative ABC transport system ATP-binding protein
MTESFLQAENLTKFYGEKAARQTALRGVSMSVTKGEFVAIRGPSGCGKSTLLHILGAMDRPTDGQVWLNGQRLDTLSPDQLAVVRRKHVGFIFQAFNLLPTLSVQENVSLPLLLEGVGESASRKRSASSLADVGLESRGRSFPSQLSGGEMQRVAIARALAIDPDLIIADEPTGSLDSVNGQRVLQLLADLNASRKITVLMATHSEEASAYASRVLYLRDGQLEEEVGTDALFATV